VERFKTSEVDGDLLLLLHEKHFQDDLGMDNGIDRMMWVRRLYSRHIPQWYRTCRRAKLLWF